MPWEQINAYHVRVLEVQGIVTTGNNDYDPSSFTPIEPSETEIDFFIRSMPIGALITFIAHRNEAGRKKGTKIYRCESLPIGGRINWNVFSDPYFDDRIALQVLNSGTDLKYGEMTYPADGWGGDGAWYVNLAT